MTVWLWLIALLFTPVVFAVGDALHAPLWLELLGVVAAIVLVFSAGALLRPTRGQPR